MSIPYLISLIFLATLLGPLSFAKNKPLLGIKQPTSNPANPSRKVANHFGPSLNEEALKTPAKGVIIAFKVWPLSKEQKKALLNKAKAQGLKEKAHYARFKTYVFEWELERKATDAQKACESFLDFPFLDYCEPDLLQTPNEHHKKPPEPPTDIYLKPPPDTFPDDQTGNIRSCRIVSSQLDLMVHPAVDQPSDFLGAGNTAGEVPLGDRLSDYWAQEMIGSDLVREDLSLYPPVQKNLVAVFDNPMPHFGRHDIGTKNIISDEGHHAVLPELGKNLTSFDGTYASFEMSHSDHLLNQAEQKCNGATSLSNTNFPISNPSEIVAYEDPYQQCRATHLPSFINRSLYAFSSDDWSGESFYRSHSALSPPSVLINAAGNQYPKPIPESLTRASQDFDAIVVGSLSPSGVKSSFSQEGEAVHIMAPSDSFLTSATESGAYKSFGGTSGATPLVTGSLAGFEWAAGYHPTGREAKLLLEKTAIATPYLKDTPRKNGVGMVNAYKLMMVGKLMKQTCGKNISCFKNMINKDDTYQFHKDPSLNEDLAKAFPNCTSTCTAKSFQNPASCADKAKAFKQLRKQAFLNPQDKELWKQIACIYGQGGFEANKKFALRIYDTLSDRRLIDDNGLKISDVYCQKDSDCVLVPHCSKKSVFFSKSNTGAEYHYLNCVENNGTTPLCNGKCRCNPQEQVVKSPSQVGDSSSISLEIGGSNGSMGTTGSPTTINYSTSCVRFQCVLNQDVVTQSIPLDNSPRNPDKPQNPPAPIAPPPSGSGSVQ